MLTRDYSLISERNIAVLGGLDTKGTEGVTRFITSRSEGKRDRRKYRILRTV
jgi:hypothetical protein